MLTLELANGVGCPQTPGRHQANYAMEVADLKNKGFKHPMKRGSLG